MKKQSLFRVYGTAALALALSLFMVSCDDDASGPADPTLTDVQYTLSTVSGAWPNQTTYIQGLKDLNLTTVDNSKATELTGSANTVAYGKSIYATPFGAPATLVKFSFNQQGVLEEEERILVPGANTFASLHFKSETVAYATVSGGISKLIIFNPSTMRITHEVALSAITKRVPSATRTYYLDMMERDNKLFMGIHYENNFSPANDSAYVAVIDLNTHAVEKVIADKRTGMVFGGQAPNTGMIKAANGDIYVQALGTTNAGRTSPSGVLRIKNGTTEFDPDYFFNLEETTGNPCFGIYQASNGRTFTARVEDKTDFWEFKTGEPQFKYVEIDLAQKSSLGAVPGLPTTYGSRRMIMHQQDAEHVLFSIATNQENAIYRFNLSTNTAGKLFASTGGFVTGLEKLD